MRGCCGQRFAALNSLASGRDAGCMLKPTQRREWSVALLLVLVATWLVGWSDDQRSSGPLVVTSSALRVGCAQRYFARLTAPSGVRVRFVEGGTCIADFYLTNASTRSVKLVAGVTREPPTALLRQVSTEFAGLPPGRCTGPGIEGYCFTKTPVTGPNGAWVVLEPGAQALMRLTYRFVHCHAALHATYKTAQQLELTYRPGPYALKREVIALGPSRLLPRRLTPSDCTPAAG
jgi:hypothetical protein